MILVIDNYDSFTWNLVHFLDELGATSRVVRNDALTAEDALALKPAAVVLSPGPKTPNEAGICLGLLARASEDLPILGVCLGHQAICHAAGARIGPALSIMHGKVSEIRHTGEDLFAGLPDPLRATRYHSLAAERASLPETLVIEAWTEDGEIMGVKRRDRAQWGVQFHPESIATAGGHALLANFLRLAGITAP